MTTLHELPSRASRVRIDAGTARISEPGSDGYSTIAFYNRVEIGKFLARILPQTSFDGPVRTGTVEERSRWIADYLTNGPQFEERGPTGKVVVFGPNCRIGENGVLEFDQPILDETFMFLLPKGSFFGEEEQLPQAIDEVTGKQRRQAIQLLEKLGLFNETDLTSIAAVIGRQPEQPHFQAATALIENVRRWQRGASMQAW